MRTLNLVVLAAAIGIAGSSLAAPTNRISELPVFTLQKCDSSELSSDGGYFDFSLKQVEAKVQPADLIRIVNAIGERGIAAQTFDGGRVSCSAVASIARVSEEASEGLLDISLMINSTCSSFANYHTSRDTQVLVVKGLINALSKIPGLEVDPIWDMCRK
ncbi:MAG: hypothetical protein NDJ89_00060 [Oligoflexia bacterium]|nr:hypothetical protein [Oligoflexia bacterium]